MNIFLVTIIFASLILTTSLTSSSQIEANYLGELNGQAERDLVQVGHIITEPSLPQDRAQGNRANRSSLGHRVCVPEQPPPYRPRGGRRWRWPWSPREIPLENLPESRRSSGYPPTYVEAVFPELVRLADAPPSYKRTESGRAGYSPDSPPSYEQAVGPSSGAVVGQGAPSQENPPLIEQVLITIMPQIMQLRPNIENIQIVSDYLVPCNLHFNFEYEIGFDAEDTVTVSGTSEKRPVHCEVEGHKKRHVQQYHITYMACKYSEYDPLEKVTKMIRYYPAPLRATRSRDAQIEHDNEMRRQFNRRQQIEQRELLATHEENHSVQFGQSP